MTLRWTIATIISLSCGEKARDVQRHEIDDWAREIEKWKLRGGRLDDTKHLGDYGADDIDLEVPVSSDVAGKVSTNQQAFIVFLGRSEYRERARLDKHIFDEIASKGLSLGHPSAATTDKDTGWRGCVHG